MIAANSISICLLRSVAFAHGIGRNSSLRMIAGIIWKVDADMNAKVIDAPQAQQTRSGETFSWVLKSQVWAILCWSIELTIINHRTA